ncbi:MAG: SLBB domain-containing protein [Pseudomonadota bacterium]
MAALLSGCAWLAPMEVPPPPDLRVPYDGPAVVAKPSPPPMGGENFFQLSQGIDERSLVLVEGQPVGADARSSKRVMQAAPGPALSLDFKPNPAWKRAVIPPDSRSAIVGRVPPPAAVPGFTIGAGDTLQIDVLGRPELTARSNVSGDGRITAALLGAVNVGGLSTAQAAMQIADAYRDNKFLLSPQVTVTMVEYQSQQLTVLGEVRNSGRYPMRTRLSVLDGLALSGGITEQGASTVYLLRPEDSVMTRYEIDLDALVQAGAGQQYFELIAGDTLVVPKSQLFYIYGEVKNPNAYKLKPGMTVIQALSLAGGLTDKGSDRRIDIRRQSDGHRLGSLSASLNDPLQADDVLYVRERLF